MKRLVAIFSFWLISSLALAQSRSLPDFDKSTLVTETRVLKRKVSKTREIVGESPAIGKIKDTIERVAPTDARVLITGENGTGKELVARWLHEKSKRADMPLIEVNCAAIPSELIESELFGHEKEPLPPPSNKNKANLSSPMAALFF